MAGGIWSPTEAKTRPGFYLNFVAAALAGIQPGARGVIACPVRAHWGPIKEFIEITRESELTEWYTNSVEDGATAYNTIYMALLGGAKMVLVYRIASNLAAVSTLTLKDTTGTPVDVIKLDAKYKGIRGNDFKITVKVNPVDGAKKDIVLYEGTAILRTFTFVSGTIDAAVNAVNNDTGNKWLVATKLAEGNGILEMITSEPMSGGNSGIADVENIDYTDAMAAFEAKKFNIFVLDGQTNSDLRVSLVAWIKRLRDEGMGVFTVIGGSADDDKTPTTGNARSTTTNHESVINVIVGAKLSGIEYCSAQLAPFIAGLIGGQKLSESITYAVCPFSDVTRHFTHGEVVMALNSGSLVLVHDGEKVKVEQGFNTLTSLRQGQNNQWKKIRAIRVMDAINNDLRKAAEDNYIGKVNNNDEGKIALINACKQYMETLVNGGLIDDKFKVYLDPDYPNPPADHVYIKWEAALTDVMEFIFSSFLVMSS